MRSVLIIFVSLSFGCGQLPGDDSKKSQSARGAPRLTSDSEDAGGKKSKKIGKRDGNNRSGGGNGNDGGDHAGSNHSDLPASSLAWDGEKPLGSSTLNLVPIE